jgi:hypothetical protein
MKELFRNPHTFDMSNYYSGMTYVIGGRDFESEDEKETLSPKSQKDSHLTEFDWSFLNLLTSSVPTKRI